MGDGTNPNSVAGDVKKLMADYGAGVVDPTLKGTIKLNQQMRDAATARDKLQELLAVERASSSKS